LSCIDLFLYSQKQIKALDYKDIDIQVKEVHLAICDPWVLEPLEVLLLTLFVLLLSALIQASL
jgi:hypothetical protein